MANISKYLAIIFERFNILYSNSYSTYVQIFSLVHNILGHYREKLERLAVT